jgi:hypothetical protein
MMSTMTSARRTCLLAVGVAAVALAVWFARGCASEPNGAAARAAATDDATVREGSPAVAPPKFRTRSPKVEPEPSAQSASSPTVRLVLTVVSEETGAPIAGADVHDFESPRHQATTDAKGEVSFEVAGPIVCDVSPAGFVHLHRYVSIDGVGDARETLKLEKAVRFVGRVVVVGTARPVAGASVEARKGGLDDSTGLVSPLDGDRYESVVADADGLFTIDAVSRKAPITVTVLAKGFARTRRTWNFSKDHVPLTSAVVELEPGGSIHGAVHDAAGAVQPGAMVVAAPAGFVEAEAGHALDPHSYSTADDDGRYEIDGLDLGGVYVVYAVDGRQAVVRRSEDVGGVRPTANAPDVALDLSFRALGTLVLEVVDAAGDHVDAEEFEVSRASQTPGADWPDLWTKDGKELPLPPGAWRAYRSTTVTAAAAEVVVDVPEGGRAVARLVLPMAATISGRLVDEAGKPAPGAAVWCDATETGGDRTTSADGTFRIDGLGPGPLTLRVRAENAPDLVRGVVAPATGLELVVPRFPHIEIRLPAQAIGRKVVVHYDVPAPPGAKEAADGWNCDVGPVWDQTAALSMTADRWDLGPGRFRICVDGFVPSVRSVNLHSGEQVVVDVDRLDPGARVVGRVVDADGAAVAGATVTVDDRLGGRRKTESGDDGAFTAPPVAPGPARLVVSSPRFVDRTFAVTASPDAPPVEFRLFHGGRLRVVAVDAKGWPVVGSELRIVDADGAAVDPAPRTDHRGRCDVRVMPGKCAVFVGDAKLGESTIVDGADAEFHVVVP